MARLLETADDENTSVRPPVDGVDRLRVARQAPAEQATVATGDLREGLPLRQAGRGGGLS